MGHRGLLLGLCVSILNNALTRAMKSQVTWCMRHVHSAALDWDLYCNISNIDEDIQYG